jgi:hypothetical protein
VGVVACPKACKDQHLLVSIASNELVIRIGFLYVVVVVVVMVVVMVTMVVTMMVMSVVAVSCAKVTSEVGKENCVAGDFACQHFYN